MKTWECVVCGAEFEAHPRAITANRCPAHRHWKRTACTTCGQTTYNANRNKPGRNVYCSSECRPKITRETSPSSGLRWRPCQHCERWICQPNRRKFCSHSCWRTYTYRIRDGRCKTCSTDIDDPQHRRSFCDECRDARHREQYAAWRRGYRSRYGKSYRARARQHGVEYELINRTKVFNRDGWNCGICRKPINRRLKPPHPMSASLDHIQPMSHGGNHTYVNVQAAHHICNSLKSNRGSGDQLALIG